MHLSASSALDEYKLKSIGAARGIAWTHGLLPSTSVFNRNGWLGWRCELAGGAVAPIDRLNSWDTACKAMFALPSHSRPYEERKVEREIQRGINAAFAVEAEAAQVVLDEELKEEISPLRLILVTNQLPVTVRRSEPRRPNDTHTHTHTHTHNI